MKRIGNILLYFSCIGIGLNIEAKQVELHFNRTIQEDVILTSPIDDRVLETPWHDSIKESTIYCQQLTIENVGHEVLTGCLPYVNYSDLYTIDSLKEKISHTKNPLLTLYTIWKESIHISETQVHQECHPLHLLNFTGSCNREDYVRGFTGLCHLMGIATRPAAIHGKECYDFYTDDEWRLLDLLSSQLYLTLDNHSLASSEEVIDDPFLALRTKFDRKASEIDFKKSWEALAHFEIVTPCLGEEDSFSDFTQERKVQDGFDLHPNEQLIYYYQEFNPELSFHQIVVEHVINPLERQNNSLVHYSSAFPIQAIYNGTSELILLEGLGLTIQPGEKLLLSHLDTFQLQMQINPSLSGQITVLSTCTSRLFPKLLRGINHVHLGPDKNPTSIQLVYDLNTYLENKSLCSIQVANECSLFDYCAPAFSLHIEHELPIEKIWWQISSDPQFHLIPANFEQVEDFSPVITIPSITETFFNANESYYFRIKGCSNGLWGEWSEPFTFTIRKPEPATAIEFNKLKEGQYEISWEASADVTDYLVFGSNLLDFIPSIYWDTQINALVDGEVIDAESIENLVAITTDPKLIVDGSLAYYRIVARHLGQLSVPSKIIHVYDHNLPQSRTVLQIAEINDHYKIVQRTGFPESYAWTQMQEPFPLPIQKNVHHFFRSCSSVPTRTANTLRAYTVSPHVSPTIWEIVKPYLLPENHPIKSKLDRMFSRNRVTLTPSTFKKAGFKRNRVGRWSRIMASNHPHLLGYFIKAFADTELSVKEDWKKFIHRIEGAKAIRDCIVNHGYQSKFKVPNKWIYPLPVEPSPPKANYYLRKNFILVAEDMKIWDHKSNEDRYYKKMNKPLLDAMYTIFQEVGLFDSVFAFNVPFCKDGKIAFIDTEYHHKWPVPFHKMSRYLSPEMEKYWNKLIREGGPQPHP